MNIPFASAKEQFVSRNTNRTKKMCGRKKLHNQVGGCNYSLVANTCGRYSGALLPQHDFSPSKCLLCSAGDLRAYRKTSPYLSTIDETYEKLPQVITHDYFWFQEARHDTNIDESLGKFYDLMIQHNAIPSPAVVSCSKTLTEGLLEEPLSNKSDTDVETDSMSESTNFKCIRIVSNDDESVESIRTNETLFGSSNDSATINEEEDTVFSGLFLDELPILR
jgi:hypothetical protein